MNAEIEDDDLVRFEAHGADPLPTADFEGWLDHDGARIWHASYGGGPRSSFCMAAWAMPATGAIRCRPSCRSAIAPS